MHDRQHYELVDWRRADTDLNYRRFFAINTLAGLRVEDPAVFDATHALVLRAGARRRGRRPADRPPGRAGRPGGYLDRLAEASGGRWTVVEKILEPGEDLPETWADRRHHRLRRARRGRRGARRPGRRGGADRAGHRAGRAAGGLRRAGARLQARGHRRHARLGGRPAGPGDRRAARHRRRRSRPRRSPSCWRASRSTAPTCPTGASTSTRRWPPSATAVPTWSPALDALHPVLAQAGTEAATRFQQTSGPVMAKGVEDTAYYRWARFVALNEVGGDPARFGSTVEEFHAAQQRRLAGAPRVDDDAVDARHQAQRGRPGPARGAGRDADRVGVAGPPAARRHPLADRPLAHLVWQTLVGAWPLSRERAHAYVEKAAREAGTSTTWTDPDAGVRGPAARAGRRRLRRRGDGARRSRSSSTGSRPFGWSNSLAQKLLQLTMPGVPDVYQGTELWDLLPGRPRQPAAGRLRPAAPAAGRRSTAGRCPAVDDDRARRSCWSSPGRCGCGGTTRSCSPATSRSPRPARRPTTWWPSTGAARSPSPPGCRLGLAAGGWGDTRRRAARPARGATCSPASGSSPTRAASPRRAARPAAGRPARPRLRPRRLLGRPSSRATASAQSGPYQ